MDSASRPDVERLLAEARQGRSDCLGVLMQLYRNYLYLLARTQVDLHLQGLASPSDLVQETFLQACGRFEQFRGNTEKELLGWLRRILINNLGQLVEKHLLARKRDARRQLSLEGHLKQLDRSSMKVEAALVSQGSSPSVQAQRRETASRVADQLARLPPDYRDVIVLRNLEGLPFADVARCMGRSPGAVRVLWLRALDRLRELNEGEDLL
jgi:RNA polymerase sigma-70 factor (ECF subfamily)